jgi:hypothetical protein
MVAKNTTAYTWDWYCHLVVDGASLLLNLNMLECLPLSLTKALIKNKLARTHPIAFLPTVSVMKIYTFLTLTTVSKFLEHFCSSMMMQNNKLVRLFLARVLWLL